MDIAENNGDVGSVFVDHNFTVVFVTSIAKRIDSYYLYLCLCYIYDIYKDIYKDIIIIFIMIFIIIYFKYIYIYVYISIFFVYSGVYLYACVHYAYTYREIWL